MQIRLREENMQKMVRFNLLTIVLRYVFSNDQHEAE